MADENIQKKPRKPPLLLMQEELLAEEVKKSLCLYNKADKLFTESFSFLKDRSKGASMKYVHS